MVEEEAAAAEIKKRKKQKTKTNYGKFLMKKTKSDIVCGTVKKILSVKVYNECFKGAHKISHYDSILAGAQRC